MTRLYIDRPLNVGDRIDLPAEELRYFKSVRRQSGDVQLFNRQGQIAQGSIEGNYFVISSVQTSSRRLYELSIAVGAPERQVLDDLIRSLSELGLKELLIFKSERSQAQNFKNLNRDRMSRLCIESMRQSERPEPLKIQMVESLKGIDLSPYKNIWFCDEAPSGGKSDSQTMDFPGLIVIGPEGGWSAAERVELSSILPRKTTQFVHSEGPIMRVHTAAITFAGAFLKPVMKLS